MESASFFWNGDFFWPHIMLGLMIPVPEWDPCGKMGMDFDITPE